MSRVQRLRTLAVLGPTNLARVGLYRLGLRTGLHPVQRLSAASPDGPFFRLSDPRAGLPEPNRSWDGQLCWYDWKTVAHGDAPPNWLADPFSPDWRLDADRDWWRIADFGAGDIKNVWELSRFGWAVALATQAARGDAAALNRLNAWIASWAKQNPPYRGPNWKCGQEASIRVMHLLLAAVVLDQDRTALPGLVQLVEAHLRRIAPTLSYAIGQQNNHGTSEAAAMFIGGDFLAGHGVAAGSDWAERGRRLLENRAAALIERDGSFSQYSVTYHRVMLDSYCLAEAWRRRRGLDAFTERCRARLGGAAAWLDAIVDRPSGDAPNIGANDGARLIPLTDTGYRDFRPSLQLASLLFRDARAIEEPGSWDDPARWLDIPRADISLPPPASATFDDGGYHVLRVPNALAVLRYPRFRFRPSQADALHLDLWHDGRNLLRDAGTFSYHADAGLSEYFAGTGAHNTVQFDGRDQMVRLSRFLFGDWLKARDVGAVRQEDGAVIAAAGYVDGKGANHHRHIELRSTGLACRDRIGGKFAGAILRWRLEPGDYVLTEHGVSGPHLDIAISAEGAPVRLSLGQAPESRHYQTMSEMPCLEVTVDQPCTLVTQVTFKDEDRSPGE